MVVTSPAPGLCERKKLATRRAIRRAALALFKSQGYAATTVEQIAQAADVAPMTVYRYFGTKEATVVSVSLTPALREGLGRMADALASDGAPTVAEVSGLVALLAAEEEDWLESLAVRVELVASTPELEQALWAQSSVWTTTLAEQLPTEALSARVQARALWRACWRGVTAPPSPTPTRSSMSSRRPSTRSESRPRSLRPEGKPSCRPPLAQPPVLLSQVTAIGYVRVSTADHSLDMQLDAFNAADCTHVFTDTASGAPDSRSGPTLDADAAGLAVLAVAPPVRTMRP